MSNLQSFTSTAEPEQDATTECIDLSGHNLAVDWSKVTAPIVIVKLTDGVGSPDKRAPAHCAGARQLGACLGGYIYLRVRRGRPQDAAQQAREFAEVYTRERCEFAVVDVELMGNEKATPAEAMAAVREFVAEWKAILNEPLMLYTSRGEWLTWAPLSTKADDLAHLPLWLAAYTLSENPPPPEPWEGKGWILHQYTGSDKATPGVDGACDRSRFRGTLAQFRAVMGLAPKLDPSHERAGM